MKVCSFLPSATEILFALGRGDDLIGVTPECAYPEEALRKPRVIRSRINPERMSSSEIDAAVRDASALRTPIYDLDEQILREGQPEVILTQDLCKVCAVDASQVQKAIRALPRPPKVLALHPHTLADMLQDIRSIGEIIGADSQAGVLVERLRMRMERVHERLADASRPRVFCLKWFDPLMSSGHWVPEQVERAGGQEVLGKSGKPSRTVAPEEIVKAAPEVLILMPCGFSIERARKELSVLTGQSWWGQLPAVQNDRVFLVGGPGYFNQSGPRAVEGIELLAGLIHPELCSDLMPSGDRRYFQITLNR